MGKLPLFAALLVLPVVAADYWLYQLGLYLLYATAAVGLGICWGQAGFLPLGQAMFFGIAAYIAGILLKDTGGGPLIFFVVLPIAALASGVLAFAIGSLVFRRTGESGPYFSLITLALSLLAYQIANTWRSVTGGFNGLAGIPGLPGLDSIAANYYVAVAALIVVVIAGGWLLSAPLGVLWRAIAQNERRVVLLGFNTNRLKAVAFGISGLFAGIGGAIYAPQQGLVSPQLVGFILSAELLIWTAVGGRGRLLGPVLGTLLIGSMTAELRDTFAWWEVAMATFFIVVVLALPQGLIGIVAAPLENLSQRIKRRAYAKRVEAPALPHHSGTPAVALEQVVVQLGEVRILNGLSVEFAGPGIICVIGPNGAGKTSAFNVLTGELPVSDGRVLLDGRPIHDLPPHRIMRRGFARKLQIPSVFPELSVADNLALALWGSRATIRDLLRPALRRWTSPILEDLGERYPFLKEGRTPASALSHGQRQILELAMALAAEPRILLLDEPCAGLSPEETAQVIDVIRWAADRLAGTIVIIEHDMSLVKELADTVVVLHEGARLTEGRYAEVQADEAVRAVYAGSRK